METPPQEAQKLVAKGRAEQKKQARSRFRLSRSSALFRLFAVLGPGLIAANAGNDAGGIATFSQAGARYGYSLLWALAISLRLVLPNVGELLSDDGRVIALVKPQFEAGREAVPRGGVVRDAAVHRDVLLRFGEDAGRAGFAARAAIRSPLKGADGNVEFLALLTPGAGTPDAWEPRWND